jgi:FHA domain
MKPIKPPDTGSDVPAAAASFLDSLKAIDVSSLDRLIAIRQENDRIAQYRAKADEKKKDVADAVYARVSQDYTKRSAALEQQSAPLRTQARAEYRKLKALIDALTRRQEQAQLEKDELQFRHEVGELTDDELTEKIAEPQRMLDSCASDRTELDQSKARFVEALGSEQALEASEPVAAPPPAIAAAPPPQAPRPAEAAVPPTEKRPLPAGLQSSAPPPRMVELPDAPLATVMEDAGATRLASRADVATFVDLPVAPGAPPTDPADGATLMVTPAALVIEDPQDAKEFLLTTINEIGRSEENNIRLLYPGISRKHAIVKAIAGGFLITDLGSQNGTFVNGQRITEQQLREGDIIDVGVVKFVFRSPWSPRAGAGASRGGTTVQGKR